MSMKLSIKQTLGYWKAKSLIKSPSKKLYLAWFLIDRQASMMRMFQIWGANTGNALSLIPITLSFEVRDTDSMGWEAFLLVDLIVWKELIPQVLCPQAICGLIKICTTLNYGWKQIFQTRSDILSVTSPWPNHCVLNQLNFQDCFSKANSQIVNYSKFTLNVIFFAAWLLYAYC